MGEVSYPPPPFDTIISETGYVVNEVNKNEFAKVELTFIVPLTEKLNVFDSITVKLFATVSIGKYEVLAGFVSSTNEILQSATVSISLL